MEIGWEGYLANGGPQGPIYGQNRQRTASNRLLESHRKQSSNGLQHLDWKFDAASRDQTRMRGCNRSRKAVADCGRKRCVGGGASRPLDYSANDAKCREFQEEAEQ